MHTLEELRQAIDQCDQQLVRWFHRRMEIVLGVADYKLNNGMAIFDPSREEAILARAKQEYGGAFPHETQEFFRGMMQISRSLQAEMLFPYHIVLIGFMGAGKTTVGKALATHLGREFVDLDQHLEAEQAKSIADIFAQEGEEVFRQLEMSVVQRCSAQPVADENYRVIACGGGAVLNTENSERLQAHGRLVLLDADPHTIWQRVGSSHDRPLLQGKTKPEDLVELWQKRQEVYQQIAGLQIDTKGKTPTSIAHEIVERLCSK